MNGDDDTRADDVPEADPADPADLIDQTLTMRLPAEDEWRR